MKKVFLYAYDHRNLGDDLFVHAITRRYPNVEFYFWSDRNNRKTFQRISNMKVLDKNSALVQMLHRLRPSFVSRYKGWLESRCNAVVYIGGSIFMEYENWEQILTWWEYEVQNRPFYILGANFGPYKSEAFRDKLADIFSDAKDICFRDQYSYKKFRKVSTARYAPDILFSYPIPKVSIIKKQLFVSPIDCSSRGEGKTSLSAYGEHYFTILSSLLKRYLSDGYRLVLASFCKEEGDEQVIQRLMDFFGADKKDGRIVNLFYDGTNTEEMIEALAESEYVIATRFHAAILALAAGRPVFPIVYSDKTIHVLEDIGFLGNYVDLRNMSSISYEDSRSNLDKPQKIDIVRLAQRAQEHFTMLDQELN